jgi:peptidoglycan/xylan/chitin deacetylase (PgdA/CDA1 family)
MPRHIACLTFDHDNISHFVARDTVSPTLISRGEFGIVAIPRILVLLAKYEIRGSFFTPGHTIESYPGCVAKVIEAGHEIGHHGWTHRVPATLGRDEEEAELVRGIETIRRATGRAPRGYRSPSWDLSPHTLDLLIAHGFDYDSSLMGHDHDCYLARRPGEYKLHEPARPGAETELVEMPISWSLDDFPHFEFSRSPAGLLPGLMNAGLVLENFVADFAYMVETTEWGILTYTFHPHVIGRGHRMMMLEQLIKKLGALGAEFMAMEDALDAWQVRKLS